MSEFSLSLCGRALDAGLLGPATKGAAAGGGGATVKATKLAALSSVVIGAKFCLGVPDAITYVHQELTTKGYRVECTLGEARLMESMILNAVGWRYFPFFPRWIPILNAVGWRYFPFFPRWIPILNAVGWRYFPFFPAPCRWIQHHCERLTHSSQAAVLHDHGDPALRGDQEVGARPLHPRFRKLRHRRLLLRPLLLRPPCRRRQQRR
jgi:hypothetical protein